MVDFSGVQQHLTAITTAQTDYAKSSFEASKAYFEKLAGVKSPDKFMELTMEHTKSAFETYVAEATKIGDLLQEFRKGSLHADQRKVLKPVEALSLPVDTNICGNSDEASEALVR
jgi:hypothetical protein